MGAKRRCLGCRRSDNKEALLRVVAVEAQCVVDWEGVLPGRGAYVHPTKRCIQNSLRNSVWPGALKKVTGWTPRSYRIGKQPLRTQKWLNG